MASLEQRGNRFRVIFRPGGEKHRVSVNSPDKKDAEACLVRLEETCGSSSAGDSRSRTGPMSDCFSSPTAALSRG